ncbi:SRPBCC domain-containing protein [Cryptosporangium japonicum]|uniref:Activator of Hsp90 ATPase homologue 1/2-like C-terminal domain-containing protein n=1 Tax=Cryptosporangium japonicum TaxID=80872 RepID=A0ABP3EL31_9ACTN
MPADPVEARRPPVRQATVVRRDVAGTFWSFVTTIGQWWPLRPISADPARAVDVVFEQRVGGRVYERWDDGTTVPWAKVVGWDPPNRFVLTWRMTAAATEVELRFTPLGPGLTRVEVEHRGWEALSEAELAQDCALPGGGYLGGSYSKGWTLILDRFREFTS